MKKNILVGYFVLICFGLNAQEFQGKAEYFTKIIFKKDFEKMEVKSDEDADFKKVVAEAMKKASEKRFLLTFNKFECLYEEQQELQKPEPNSGGFAISFSFSGDGKKYLNSKDKSSIVEGDVFGKEFLITEKLESFNWKLLDETKKIGNYSCFKAEVIIPVSEKQKQEYAEFLKQEEKKSSLFKMEEPKDKVVVAWYTPEIPVSFGPDNYWGLPGLILEINEEEKIILCSKVTLNNKATTKIKQPNVGKKVSQKEFDKIEKDKIDSMKDENGDVIIRREN